MPKDKERKRKESEVAADVEMATPEPVRLPMAAMNAAQTD